MTTTAAAPPTTDTTPATDEPPTTAFARVVDVVSRILVAAVALAIIWNSYNAMVAFCVDRLGLSLQDSQIVAITIEGALLSTAVLALRNALRGRSYAKLMAATWFLAALSGVFAGADQIYLGHGAVGALFRFFVPLLGAGLIHELLNIDKNQAVGFALLSDLRQAQRDLVAQLKTDAKKRKETRKAEKLMLAHIRAIEARRDELARAQRENREPRDMDKLDKAERDTQKAAIAVLGISEFTRRLDTWTSNLKKAAERLEELYRIVPAGVEPLTASTPLSPVQTSLSSPQPTHRQAEHTPGVDGGATRQAEPPVAAAAAPAPTAAPRKASAARTARTSKPATAAATSASSTSKAERDDRIRLMSAAGIENAEIASDLGVTIRTVQRALKRDADAPAHTPGGGTPVVAASGAAAGALVGAH